MKIVSIVGTRPNFMKIAPLIEEIKKHKNIRHVLIHTGQHYDLRMSKLFFDDLGLPKPDEHLVCQTDVGVDEQREFLRNTIRAALERQKPDLVIVVGDVNSTVAGAQAAHELGIKVAHVEGGLRSFDMTMPEEVNRIETDKISDFLFTTEESGNRNLKSEGIDKSKIFFVGNVMIDSLLKHKEKAKKSEILGKLNLTKNNYALLTLHRPSNVDSKGSLGYVIGILSEIQKKIKIAFPVHPRTVKNLKNFGLYGKVKNQKNIILTEPLGYLDFINLMINSKFVITDSGGIQEETTVLGIPCITMRNNTERPVTASQGTNILVSTDKANIIEAADKLVKGASFKPKMPQFWDGKAAKRIVEVILKNFS
ncbi:UDP-N-acetylglucosamine 2-epimerase (non-hydrolyzing) [Candidatus Woesearchaeota archaeon]|nr:UDP-N-acetylglucosamine 2-epimerase (non-hydrolyzing) [Candidatus Woesearchaeota archaeon]